MLPEMLAQGSSIPVTLQRTSGLKNGWMDRTPVHTNFVCNIYVFYSHIFIFYYLYVVVSLCTGSFFCHQNKFLVCANILGNKALSGSGDYKIIMKCFKD